MVEVAMKSVEAVFDWKAYLNETFGYEVDDSWLVDEPIDEETAEDRASVDAVEENGQADEEAADGKAADADGV